MSEFLTFLSGDYKLIQDDEEYCFSADSVLLANLACIGTNDNVIDLGSGSGVISTLVAVKKNARRVVGIELNPRTVELSKKSSKMNKLTDRQTFICGDVKKIGDYVSAGEFDKAVCNPPYFVPDTQVSSGRKTARSEAEGGLNDFISAAAYALKNGGDLFISYKLARLCDLICALRENGLEPKHVTFVYPKFSKGADVVIVSAKKGGKCGLLSDTLIIMDEEGRYTPRVKELYS